MDKLTYFLFIITIAFNGTFAQNSVPLISNFTVDEYKGGNQNWGIDNSNDFIYVANNEGLLEFDGLNWNLHSLPQKTIIRSVKVIDDRIYTGTYEDLGYWKRDEKGELKYFSLRDLLTQKDIKAQSIWGIYQYKKAVIFKSFTHIYIYEDNSIKVLKPNTTLMAGIVFKNRFLVHGIGKGLLEYKKDSLTLVEGTESIADKRVQAMVNYNDRLLIGTSLNGCFVYNKKITPWSGLINNTLKEAQLNTLSLKNDNLIIGTINKGVYKYNVTNDTHTNFHVKNGLQNNTVLSSKVIGNYVWLALDNGISIIPLKTYAYYLNVYKKEIGAVYDIALLKNKLYIATNTGVYKIINGKITFIKGSEGHTWSLFSVGDKLICGHNKGTYLIDDESFTLLDKKNGGYVFKPIPEKENTYIQGNYAGITMYTKKNNIWSSHSIDGIEFPVKNIVFEKPKVLWLQHAHKGVFRVHLSNDYKKVIKIETNYIKNFENIYNVKLFSINKNVAFYNKNNWKVYNALENKIEDFKSLNILLGKENNATLISSFNNKPLVFKGVDNSIFIRKSLRDSTSQFNIPKRFYIDKLVRSEGEQKVMIVKDSLLFLPLYDDVLQININKIDTALQKKIPKINKIYKNRELQKLSNSLKINRNDTLKIEFGNPFSLNNELEYSVNNNKWKPTLGSITITGLPYKENEIKIRVISNNSVSNLAQTIRVFVPSPWYLGKIGVLLLLLLIIIIFIFIKRVNNYMLIKQKKYLEEKHIHQQQLLHKEIALNNEIKINELLKIQHKKELKIKTKELANTAMEMIKKDEFLATIKNDLADFKNEIINKEKFDKLLKRVNRNINTQKDWEIFETSFNEIHDSFFKALVKRHKSLTAKDLKLCAYLKMNLSTKEIAPLLGISVRGVEIHRYRLRKKLNLTSSQNLTEYLINLL